MTAHRRRTLAGIVAAAGLFVVALVAAPNSDAASKPLKPYPVPCKQCHYVADHRAEVDHVVTTPGTGSGNGGTGGWRKTEQRWEMLNGFCGFRISKVGRTHVNSGEWFGQDEHGPHAFTQVWFYVRKATPAGKTPVVPAMVGGKTTDPTRVTDPIASPRFSTTGRVNVSRKIGETLQGLECVFVADNRGTPLVTVVRPDDVPFAAGGKAR